MYPDPQVPHRQALETVWRGFISDYISLPYDPQRSQTCCVKPTRVKPAFRSCERTSPPSPAHAGMLLFVVSCFSLGRSCWTDSCTSSSLYVKISGKHMQRVFTHPLLPFRLKPWGNNIPPGVDLVTFNATLERMHQRKAPAAALGYVPEGKYQRWEKKTQEKHADKVQYVGVLQKCFGTLFSCCHDMKAPLSCWEKPIRSSRSCELKPLSGLSSWWLLWGNVSFY